MDDLKAQLDAALAECRDLLLAAGDTFWASRFEDLYRSPLSVPRRARTALMWFGPVYALNGQLSSADDADASKPASARLRNLEATLRRIAGPSGRRPH